VLVDYSASEFHCLSSSATLCPNLGDTAWGKFKESVRAIVGMSDQQVRFGFSTIWGTNPAAGGMCPSQQGMLTDNLPPALNNATAIMAKYDALALPPNSTQQGTKFEGPISSSVQAVGLAMSTISEPGEKFILLVTTGQGDYCDDSNNLCPADSTVFRIQANRTAGITTLVLGLEATSFDLPGGLLQAFANAGTGEPTVAPLRTGDTLFAFYDQCSGFAGWHNDLFASGKPNARGTTLGTYATTAGPSRAFAPTTADQAALAALFRSCTFNLVGASLSIDQAKLNLAHIKIDGTDVPLDGANGWNMPNPTQVVLNGNSCTTWRAAANKVIDFQFPCETLVFK
jgi:hypothetical protein